MRVAFVGWGAGSHNTPALALTQTARTYHRYRQHPAAGDFACAEKGCKCQGFFYIFAEGAFMLKCRCVNAHG